MLLFLGLLCYAYGLRNRGFELLNAVGCTSSIDHIRAHGSYWASKLQPVQELNVNKLWHISVDNTHKFILSSMGEQLASWSGLEQCILRVIF